MSPKLNMKFLATYGLLFCFLFIVAHVYTKDHNINKYGLCQLSCFANVKDSLEEGIKRLHLKKFTWMIDKQLDSLNSLLHDEVHYIHSNGWKEDKAEVLANLLSGKLTYNQVEVHECQARMVDQTAVVTGKATFYVTMEGTSNAFNLYYTEVYVRDQNRFKLLSRHACKY